MRRDGRERVYLDARRHGIVLALPFARAFVLAGSGGFLFTRGSPFSLAGAALVIVAAAVALRAVWRWERTHVMVTSERLAVVHGTVRRRTTSVWLDAAGPVEVEQTLFGRLFGYGTLVAGSLSVHHVPQPKHVDALVERLSA